MFTALFYVKFLSCTLFHVKHYMCAMINAFVGLIDNKKYVRVLIIRIGRKKIITAISKNVFDVKHTIKGQKVILQPL